MKNLFKHTSSSWVCYSEYEWKTKNDVLYITPAKGATPHVCNPLENPEDIVLDAMNVGLKCLLSATPQTEIKQMIMDFVSKYGLLGIMSALPSTANFITYEKVYLPKNQYIKNEVMETEDYLDIFFPFEKIDFEKHGVESAWSSENKSMMALTLTFGELPQAQLMSFSPHYAERYDWLKSLFRDWAFMAFSSFIYYHDKDVLSEEELDLYRQGMAAFDGNSPSYHIELRDKPTLVWDFHSLLLCIQMMLCFMLADESNPLRLCSKCVKPFVAKSMDQMLCEDC